MPMIARSVGVRENRNGSSNRSSSGRVVFSNRALTVARATAVDPSARNDVNRFALTSPTSSSVRAHSTRAELRTSRVAARVERRRSTCAGLGHHPLTSSGDVTDAKLPSTWSNGCGVDSRADCPRVAEAARVRRRTGTHWLVAIEQLRLRAISGPALTAAMATYRSRICARWWFTG